MSAPPVPIPPSKGDTPSLDTRPVNAGCLTSWYVDAGDRLTPVQLRAVANVRVAVGRHGRVVVIALGPAARQRELTQGLHLRVLPATDVGLSWDLPEALADCDLVHLLEPFSRAGEMGMLLAKLHGTPVCACHNGTIPVGVGAAVDLLTLADAVIPADATPERLALVYRDLVAGCKEAAA